MLEAKARTNLAVGDMLITRNEGGPGYGDPLRRDPARVDADVRTRPVHAAGRRADLRRRGQRRRGMIPTLTRERREQMRRARLDEAMPVSEAIERYGVEGALAGGGV